MPLPREGARPSRRRPPSAGRRGYRRSWCDPGWPCGPLCGSPEKWRISSRPPFLPDFAKAVHQRALAMYLRIFFAQQHLLEREHALGPLQVIELKAPVDRFQELPRVLLLPHLRRGDVAVLLGALIGGLWRGACKTGEHARADGVAIAPGPEQVAVLVLLGRGEAGRIHRR